MPSTIYSVLVAALVFAGVAVTTAAVAVVVVVASLIAQVARTAIEKSTPENVHSVVRELASLAGPFHRLLPWTRVTPPRTDDNEHNSANGSNGEASPSPLPDGGEQS